MASIFICLSKYHPVTPRLVTLANIRFLVTTLGGIGHHVVELQPSHIQKMYKVRNLFDTPFSTLMSRLVVIRHAVLICNRPRSCQIQHMPEPRSHILRYTVQNCSLGCCGTSYFMVYNDTFGGVASLFAVTHVLGSANVRRPLRTSQCGIRINWDY